MAYQGYGLGLDRAALAAITRFATGGLVPHRTFYVDVPVEVGIARKQRGETNRLDEKAMAYHARVRAGFLEMARAEPGRWIIVDGTRSVDDVQKEIRERIAPLVGLF
jgi:dTMP kinase